jgi:hypothetical protein
MPLKPPLWERIVNALLAPFHFLSSLGTWIEWAADRFLVVHFSVLSEIIVWFAWALEQTLRAPAHAFSILAEWIGRRCAPETQINEGFKPLWQRVLLLSCNLVMRPVYITWRLLSSPFRRRID